jgi:membrane-bound ClpP family serine protease
MRKKTNKSVALFSTGTVIFALGLFFGYGIVIFAGLIMMVAGLLPPAEHEPEDESDSV